MRSIKTAKLASMQYIMLKKNGKLQILTYTYRENVKIRKNEKRDQMYISKFYVCPIESISSNGCVYFLSVLGFLILVILMALITLAYAISKIAMGKLL